jgi:hypothetical protein
LRGDGGLGYAGGMKFFRGGAAAAIAMFVLAAGCGNVTPVDGADGGGGSSSGSGGSGQAGAGGAGAGGTGAGGTSAAGMGGAGGTSPTGAGGAGGAPTTGAGGSGGSPTTGAGGGAGSGAGGSAGSGAGGSGGTSTNLVPNGDFSAPGNDWHVFDQVNQVDTPGDSSTGQLCYTATSTVYASITMGWPVTLSNVAMLASTGSYTFSYSASFTGPGPVTMASKVGSATAPLLTSISWNDTVTTTPTTFTHQFPGTGDNHTGIAFNVTLGKGTTICVDNIVLMQN